ncbi:MAG: two-component regulator propeller domain-containing protein [Bacteroidia bacterium]|nr:two-component regulator propeller domain-containing protein [Bacteroidia bacterium]
MFILDIVSGEYPKKILFLTFFLGYLGLFLKAQLLDLNFRKLSLEKGLSQSNVTSILKDQKGFMWVGTQNGLNRYDAYSFQRYSTVNGLDEAYVSTLLQSRDGSIWVGNTQGSLNVVDPVSLKLSSLEVEFPVNGRKGILRIFEDKQGKIWISTRTGLHVYDITANRFFHFPEQEKKLSSLAVYGVISGEEDVLWVACQQGILGLSNIEFTDKGEIQADIQKAPEKYPYLHQGLAFRIIPSQNGGMWINAWQKGFVYFHPKSEDYKFYPLVAEEENGEAIEVFDIAEDAEGNLWGSSKNHGLIKLNPQSAALEFVRYDADRESSLGSNTLMGLYIDEENGIWAGTYGAGLNYHHPDKSKFRHIRADDPPNGLSYPLVYSIYPSRFDESLWVGTHGGGLNRIVNRNSPESYFSHYLPELERKGSLKDEVVISLAEDGEENLWVGSYHGLSILAIEDKLADKGAFVFEGELGDTEGWNVLEKAAIWAMVFDQKGRMWIGTNEGLFRKDPDDPEFKHFVHEPDNPHSLRDDTYLRRIYEGADGSIWIATSKGLHRYREESQDFEIYSDGGETGKALSSSNTFCVLRDRDGRIWVGMQGSGLNVILPGEGDDFQVLHFFETDGIPSNLIMGLLEDEFGQIWGSSSNGLFRFHPDSLITHSKEAEDYLRLYDSYDGLQSNEFLEGSFAKDAEGKLYFGGVNGYSVFHPSELQGRQEEVPLYLSRLKVLNKEVRVGEEIRKGEIPLEKALCNKENLYLSWRDYFFSIDFSALNYEGPEKTEYSYKLDGLHQEWIEIGLQRSVTFTNLDPGDYTLRVKASNADGIWNKEERRLGIHISTPPWKSWWAYCLYVLGILGLISLYIRFRIREREKELQTKMRIEEAKMEEREVVRKNTAADFHDELGNKMTKISLFIELAKRAESANQTLQVYLNQVEENTQILSQGIRDFIWVLDPEKDSVYDMMIRIKDFGDELFEHTGINFICEGIHPDQSAFKLPLNSRRHLMLIVKETMNNALKYAEAQNLYCRLKVADGKMDLEIEDDGKGFDPEQLSKGYGLKNMRERAKRIGANIEIESADSKGTRIGLIFELTHMGD